MKNLKIILLLLVAASMLLFSACVTTDTCEQHTDVDKDGFCDICNEKTEAPVCTECKDSDSDGKCDACGKTVEKKPCAECRDGNGDGRCDVCGNAVITAEELTLIENGTPTFTVVVAGNLDANATKAVDDFIAELGTEYGIYLVKVLDAAYTEQACELLIGEVISRGEKYQKDIYAYGPEGYAVELVDTKVVITLGSQSVIADALEAFKTDFLGITDGEIQKNVVVTKENNVSEIQEFRVKKITLFGNDIKGFTIAADKNVESEYSTALELQNLIYTKTGYRLDIVSHDKADKSIVIKLVERTGGLGYSVTMEENRINVTCEYFTCIEKETMTFFETALTKAGKTGVAEFNASNNTEINVRDVFYKDFGATGDDKSDDSEAIRACHEYANQAGHTVNADYNAVYYIGEIAKTINIKTNVNWHNAVFYLEDYLIEPSNASKGVNIFTLPSTGSLSVSGLSDWRKEINKTGGLDASTLTKIPVSFGENALLVITDSNHKNYIRYGVNANSGAAQKEIILVDKDGNIDPTTPLMFDYEQVSGITVYKIDAEPLTVQGGTFYTSPYYTDKPQAYTAYSRGLKCARSNVTFKNIKHYLINEGSYKYKEDIGDYGCPYGGFYNTALCNNVRYENCVASAHVVYKGSNGAGMGTYDISPGQSTNVVFKNCYQEDGNFFATDAGGMNRWGIMGSSYCKNITFEDTKFTRFDAHNGIHNVYLIRSTLSMIRIDGTGTFYMEGCTMYSNTFIGFREDYGGYWHGNIILKDNTIITSNSTTNLFTNTWYNHYFGYPAAFPTNIIIDNLNIYSDDYQSKYTGTVNLFGSGVLDEADKSAQPYLQSESNKYQNGKPVMLANKNMVPAPERIIIRNTNVNIVLPDVSEYPWFENTVFSVNEETECTHHIDIDHDLICDDCKAETVPCEDHNDANHDGYCTWCNKDVEIPCGDKHRDIDENGLCDICKAAYTCEGHADANKDHICDNCLAPMCNGEHIDVKISNISIADGYCDVCKEKIED